MTMDEEDGGLGYFLFHVLIGMSPVQVIMQQDTTSMIKQVSNHFGLYDNGYD